MSTMGSSSGKFTKDKIVLYMNHSKNSNLVKKLLDVRGIGYLPIYSEPNPFDHDIYPTIDDGKSFWKGKFGCMLYISSYKDRGDL